MQTAASEADVEGFERLDKWRMCERDVGAFFVCRENLTRAENTGFPSALEVGKSKGLSPHEVAALMGWSTGDFRFVNPIARGLEEVVFEDYPLGAKASCRLVRADVMPYVGIISSALRALPPVPAGHRLWRGHRSPVLSDAGAILTFGGFTSTTYDRDEALRFATQLGAAGSSPRRALLAIEEHASGRSVASFSARRGELEVLFPLDRRFQVLPPPPEEQAEADARAVREALEQLRQHMPEAEIDLVYLRELGDEA
mmetsp:Transcript_26357/g.83465  ORF Transcript_26357/g.83465 Transcript_26357/m.83465 type:complete len:256 (+) Transcript_26357:104-871(+)